MFDAIRNRQRLMYALLLLLIFPPFVMFGLDGFTKMHNGSQNVAEVNGVAISQQEFSAVQRNRLEELRAQYGPSVDAKLLDTPEARQALLDQLVRERVQGDYQNKSHVAISDNRVVAWLAEQPQFRGANGKFDRKLYQQYVQARGLTEAAFEGRIRSGLSYEILPTSVTNTALVPQSVSAQLYKVLEEQRTIRELVFDRKDFQSQVKLADDAVSAFYKANQDQFKVAEQADVEYLVLDEAAAAALVMVKDADLQAFYEQNKSSYTSPEQRRASHILVQVAKDASAEDRKKLKEKAQRILGEVRQQPEKFAEFAKKNSDDPGSKTQGGDLGFFGKGMMVKPFEDAAFKLKPSEISDLVESDFGWHIIKLAEVKAAQAKPLADVRDQVQQEVRKQLALRKFSELSDQFSELVFKNPENVNAVAQALKLSVQKVQGLSKQAPAGTQLAVYQDKFIQAIFADDAVRSKKLTDVIEVGNNSLIAGRVVAYRPASVRPQAEVETAIRQRLLADEAEKLAVKSGESALASIKDAKATAATGLLNKFTASRKVSRSDPASIKGIPTEALRKIFQHSTTTLPAYVGVTVAGKGYVIYQIESVSSAAKVESTVEAAKISALNKQLAGVYAEAGLLAAHARLREQAKIKLYSTAIARADAE